MPEFAEDKLALIAQQLEAAGWPKEGLLREPLVVVENTRRRPSIFLSFHSYPLAALEIVRQESNHERARVQPTESRLRVPLMLEANGSFTTLQGVSGSPRWSPVPTPRQLWELLGREWIDSDPRLVHTFEEPLRVHQMQAITAVLDALLEGRRHVQLLLPIQSGITWVLTALTTKLLLSGRCARALYLTHLRAVAHQTHDRFQQYGRAYETSLLQQYPPSERARVHVGTVAYFLNSSRTRRDAIPADFYDLILIPELKDLEGWRKVTERFPNATVIGIAPQLPLDDPEFGPPVFEVTIRDLIAADDPAVPAGFRRIRLGDIAEVSAGSHHFTEVPDQKGPPLLRAGDLSADGTLSLPSREGSAERPALDRRTAIRPHDILIAAIQSPTLSRVALVPAGTPEDIQIHSSLIRIRVQDPRVSAVNVASFLRSDAGRQALGRLAYSPGGSLRLTPMTILATPILIPDVRSVAAPEAPAGDSGAIAASDATTDQATQAPLPADAAENPTTEPPVAAATGPADPPQASLSAARQALQQLRESIIPALEALDHPSEAKDPSDVAARLQDIASSLAPPPLSERVLRRYPMPIAIAYRRFLDSRFNVYEQVFRLRDLFEAASFFIYNAVLADACRRLDPAHYYIPEKVVRTAYDGFSMAHRISFVEKVIAVAHSRDVRELFISKLGGSAFVEKARRLQDFRNQISHSATASESRQRELLKGHRPIVEAILEDLAFLEDYRLSRTASIHMSKGRYIRRIELYQGVAPVLDEHELDADEKPALAEHDHLVLLDENDDHLDLYPMYQFVADQRTSHETHICFLKQRRCKTLQGESVQGAAELELDGATDFEQLRARLRDTP